MSQVCKSQVEIKRLSLVSGSQVTGQDRKLLIFVFKTCDL